VVRSLVLKQTLFQALVPRLTPAELIYHWPFQTHAEAGSLSGNVCRVDICLAPTTAYF